MALPPASAAHRCASCGGAAHDVDAVGRPFCRWHGAWWEGGSLHHGAKPFLALDLFPADPEGPDANARLVTPETLADARRTVEREKKRARDRKAAAAKRAREAEAPPLLSREAVVAEQRRLAGQ